MRNYETEIIIRTNLRDIWFAEKISKRILQGFSRISDRVAPELSSMARAIAKSVHNVRNCKKFGKLTLVN